MKAKKTKIIAQQIVPSRPKTNGVAKKATNGLVKDHNSRTFETRLLPRYDEMPDLPAGLPEPNFSESSNKILKERYLLKDEKLQPAESIAERFWRVAYDVASAEFDFGASKAEVAAKATAFYQMMVLQQFEPNSPTLMNAGKQNGLQYSACFVLPVDDSMEAIFESVKAAALIHKTGGGCIAADSRVWTTFCGIEPIETLFARATVDGRRGVRQGSGLAVDVRDLNIKTVSMDPQTGQVGLQPVSHVWRYQVPLDQQLVVTTAEGTTVQTSLWHPFIVLRETQLVEIRADELVKGDVVLGPAQPDSYWPWQANRVVNSVEISPELGWLIGFTLGDGSFGYVPALRQYRVRWFSGTEDVLQRVQQILAHLGIEVSIQKDGRGLLSLATLNQRFVHDLLEACGLEKFGAKDKLIRVPELIAKSPLSVVRAFVAGLLDSDGYVAPDGSPSYSSVSEKMSQDLAALVSLLGFHPSVKAKQPHGKGRLVTYTVQICPLPQVDQLFSQLQPFLANSLRLKRLHSQSRKQTALPLKFRLWRDELRKHGLVQSRGWKVGAAGPLASELNVWASVGRISRASLGVIAQRLAVANPEMAQLLERVADSGQEVVGVEKAKVAQTFYDLSVEKWNTYAAGKSGMLMIHNTGFAFSRLRASNSRVSTTGGIASGPVTFLKVFNAATEAVKQGGTRRGANMGILRVDHPDVLEFIRSKAELDDHHSPIYEAIAPFLPNDEVRLYFKQMMLDRQIANFNISVAMTDKFMEAYFKGENFDLVDPRDKSKVGELNAKEVFDEIIERAWHTGDPGVVFIDRINHSTANPVQELEEIESTNPSLRAGTKVLTKDGVFPIESLDRKRFYVKNLDGQWSPAECFLSGKNKPLYQIVLGNGRKIYATAEHKWPVLVMGGGFGKVTTEDLKPGQILPFPAVDDVEFDGEKFTREEGFMLGWLYGDGWITQRQHGEENQIIYPDSTRYDFQAGVSLEGGLMSFNAEQRPLISRRLTLESSNLKDFSFGFLFSKADLPMAQTVLREVNKLKNGVSNLRDAGDNTHTIQVTSSVFAHNLLTKFGVDKKDQGLPKSVWHSGGDFIKGFIDGLFSSDGFVHKYQRHVILTTKHPKLVQDVADLLSFYGIKSTIRRTMIKSSNFPNGKKYSKVYERSDLAINGYHAVNFAKIFKLSHPNKQARLNKLMSEYKPTRKEADAGLIRIVSVGATNLREDVWDISVNDKSHCFYINGCVTGNCGEQPLAPWDACNLGSINLGKFVRDDGQDLEWSALKQAVVLATNFLDNVVQVNPYTLKQIYDEVHNNRRIGLGVMGFADMLFLLGVPYNSDEALEWGERVMEFINEAGHEESERLAEVRGAFPNWEYSIYHDDVPGTLRGGKPIRNSTVTTIAPTGTISIIADCASGIEPVFALAYLHKAKTRGNEVRTLVIANKTFEEIAKREGFYTDDLAQKVMDHGSVAGMAEVPERWQRVFVTAQEIEPDWHVKMQAAFQRHTDNGVSKTINLPNSATREDIKRAYLMAWETGCNGITVYRDGSKVVQVLNISSSLKPKVEGNSGQEVVEEPKPNPNQSRPMVLRGRTYKIITPVGEGFVTVNRDENDLPFEVFVTVSKGGTHIMADAEAIGRLISMSLRTARGVNRREVAQKIASQLRGIGGANHIGFGKDRIMSLADAIGKVLAEDLAASEAVSEGELIPLNLTIDGGTEESGRDDVVAPAIVDSSAPLAAGPLKGADICPECGVASFVREDGCEKCYSCGYSKC